MAKAKPLYRFFEFDRTQVNSEDRTVPVAFSSEHPVDRGEYDEILDHTPEGVDLVRLKDSHPLLLNHDPDKQIGVIEKAELSTDKRGRALIRFGRSDLANEIFQDVKDGIRKHLSVGYERIKAMATETKEGGRRCIRFAWRPFELSIVPVPADPTVGVGRSKDAKRTMANDDVACVCRNAWGLCNDLVGKIESHGSPDAAHTAAASLCREAIACLVMTWEDVQFWSEATAADCVAVCAECAGICDRAISAIRAIAGCPECGTAANSAIEELEDAAEACRENAGIKPENTTAESSAEVVAEGETGGTVIDANTRSNVDATTLTNAVTVTNGTNNATTMRILFDAAPANPANAPGGGAPPKTVNVEEVRSSTIEGERTRVKNIRTATAAIAKDFPDGADKFRTMADEAVDKGTTPEDFNAELLKAIPGVRKAPQMTCASLGMSTREQNQYSLARAVQSVLSGRSEPDGLEGQVHKEMLTRIKANGAAVTGSGFWVPHDIGFPTRAGNGRRDLNVGTFAQGGAFVQTTILTPIIEILRNRMVTQRLGVQSMAGLEGNIAIPRQTGAATAYTLPESATLTKSTQALDQVSLTPHRVGAYNEYSKQLLLQSSVDVENFIRDDLMKVLAIKWDKLILEGSGAASEPTGILNTTGIGSVHFGATATYAKLVAFVTALRLANADAGSMAYVTTPTVRGALETTPKIGTTFPIFIWEGGEYTDGSDDGKIGQYRATSTNQISNDRVSFGHWADAIHALWGGFDVVVNPYSRDIDAVVRITVNTFGDVAVRHAASFAWSDDSGAQ